MTVNPSQTAKAIADAVQLYLKELQFFTEEQFTDSPPSGGWSFSELYCHLVQANNASLLAIEKCLYGQAGNGSSRAPLMSRIILYFGKLPRQRYKAPSKLASLVKKISREDARNQMISFTNRLKEVAAKLVKSPGKCRVRHPRLGMLNTLEWLRFIEIHTNHHLKQLKRIKKDLRLE